MIIHYQLTVDDLLALQKNYFSTNEYHVQRGNLAFVLLLLFSYFSGSSLLVRVLPGYMPADFIVPVSIVGGIIIALLLSPFLRKLYFNIQIWRYRVAVNRAEYQNWPKECLTTLNNEGLKLSAKKSKVQGETEFVWGAFIKLSEDRERFFLYHTDADAVIIPKHTAAISEEDKNKIENLLNQQLGHLIKKSRSKQNTVDML